MSNTIISPTASAVNTPLLARPDPIETVKRMAKQYDLSYSEILSAIRERKATIPADTEWKHDVEMAAMQLAAPEREAEFQRVMAAADRRIAAERAESDRIAAANGGRYCRQCRKWNGCGHVMPKGR